MDALELRAARHAALGDPLRLRIVDELSLSDRSPVELRRTLGIESNLLAHHLEVLAQVGLVFRHRSSGDQRRRYVQLSSGAVDGLARRPQVSPQPALFVCTANSARSQLAAGLWRHEVGEPAFSAGTHPAPCVEAGAVAAARRAGFDLGGATPTSLASVSALPALVITVCDRAHEQLDAPHSWLHWSIPDPVPVGTDSAFDTAVAELRARIRSISADRGQAA